MTFRGERCPRRSGRPCHVLRHDHPLRRGHFFLQVEANRCHTETASAAIPARSYAKSPACYIDNPQCYREFRGCYTAFAGCYKFQAPKIAGATSAVPTAFFEGRLSLCYRANFKNTAKGRSLAGYAFCGHKTLLPAPAALDRPGWYEVARSCLRPVDDGGPRSRRRGSDA
jgi:hypothetical protein